MFDGLIVCDTIAALETFRVCNQVDLLNIIGYKGQRLRTRVLPFIFTLLIVKLLFVESKFVFCDLTFKIVK